MNAEPSLSKWTVLVYMAGDTGATFEGARGDVQLFADLSGPLKADLEMLAARDLHFEHTKRYFEEHDAFDEPSWREATGRLAAKLRDAEELGRRAAEIRARAETLVQASK